MSKLRIALFLSALASASSLGVACGSSSSNGGGGASSGGASSSGSSSGASSSGTSSGASSSSSGASSGSSSGAGDGGFVQASHLPFPGVVYGGEPLITAPKVVSITFANDTLATQLDGFGAVAAATSNWWPAVMSEYCQGAGTGCIGKGPAGTSVVLDAGTPSEVNDPSSGADDAGASAGENLQTLLQGLMASGAVPPPDANTIYTLYLPDSVTFNGTASPCENLFEGYHSEGTYNGTNYVYAIVIECADLPIASLGDNTTETAAHEIAESASDGFSNPTTGAGGYYIDFNDPNTWAWNDDSDGEIADLCVDNLNLGQDKWVEGSYSYQRIWSVKAAAANENPCHPIPSGEVYFNAAPASAFLEANVGETITIEVDAFSDAPRGEWALLAFDSTDPTGATTYTNLAFNGTTYDGGDGQPVVFVNNGSKPQLSITLTQDPTNVGNGAAANYDGEADITLWSFDANGGTDITKATAGHYWELAVMTRADAQDAGVTLVDGAVPLDLPHLARPLRTPRPGMRPQHVHRAHPRPGFSR